MRNPARRILASPQATPTHNNFDILKEQDGDEAHVDDVVETQTEKGAMEDARPATVIVGLVECGSIGVQGARGGQYPDINID